MTGLQGLISEIGNIVKALLPIASGLALLGFFWGLAIFIFQAGDEAAVDKGKRIMKWGLISLFVMFSVWGIISFFQTNLGVQGGAGIVQVRQVP